MFKKKAIQPQSQPIPGNSSLVSYPFNSLTGGTTAPQYGMGYPPISRPLCECGVKSDFSCYHCNKPICFGCAITHFADEHHKATDEREKQWAERMLEYKKYLSQTQSTGTSPFQQLDQQTFSAYTKFFNVAVSDTNTNTK